MVTSGLGGVVDIGAAVVATVNPASEQDWSVMMCKSESEHCSFAR